VVTLSFLITTPEAWVPALGDAQHGFPYLSGMGRLIWKDTIMMAGAVVVMADSAKSILESASRNSKRRDDLELIPAEKRLVSDTDPG